MKIIKVPEGHKCTKCDGINECHCIGPFPDPICDCGELAFACKCDDRDFDLDQDVLYGEYI